MRNQAPFAGLVAFLLAAVFVPPVAGQSASELTTIEVYGDWEHVRNEDPFGESNADGAITGGMESAPFLSILCYDGGTRAFMLSTDEFLGLDTGDDPTWRDVKFTFDSGGEVYSGRWFQSSASVTGSTVGIFREKMSDLYQSLLEGSKQHAQVHFRIEDYEGTSHDESFSLNGFTAAYEAACGSP